jgi:hypothetical protein
LGEERKQKGVGRTPADLHPPLNKTGLGLEVKQIKEGNDSLPTYRLFKIANRLVRIMDAPRRASMIKTSISMPTGCPMPGI